MLQRNALLDSAHYSQLPVLSEFYILLAAKSNDNDYERSPDATFKGHAVATSWKVAGSIPDGVTGIFH